jgi:hypothetical protein
LQALFVGASAGALRRRAPIGHRRCGAAAGAPRKQQAVC